MAFINISKCDSSFIVASHLLQSVMNRVLRNIFISRVFILQLTGIPFSCVYCFSVYRSLCLHKYMIHINKNIHLKNLSTENHNS